jgi:hypothetical protein
VVPSRDANGIAFIGRDDVIACKAVGKESADLFQKGVGDAREESDAIVVQDLGKIGTLNHWIFPVSSRLRGGGWSDFGQFGIHTAEMTAGSGPIVEQLDQPEEAGRVMHQTRRPAGNAQATTRKFCNTNGKLVYS